ncbi:MAG: hypothetical protein ACOZQL_29160 [Myxococcota bacterium]
MKKTMLMAALTMAMALTGCGGGAAKVGGGKQGAANALAAASKPTKAGANAAATPVDVMPVNYSCPHGGSATLGNFTQDISTSGATAGSISQKFTVTYSGCGLAESEAGVAVYDGSFTVTQSITGSDVGGTISQRYSGRVTIGGAFSDFLEADVSQEISGSALESATGSVKLVGKLTNASGTYSYDERLSVSGGKLEISSSQAQ